LQADLGNNEATRLLKFFLNSAHLSHDAVGILHFHFVFDDADMRTPIRTLQPENTLKAAFACP